LDDLRACWPGQTVTFGNVSAQMILAREKPSASGRREWRRPSCLSHRLDLIGRMTHYYFADSCTRSTTRPARSTAPGSAGRQLLQRQGIRLPRRHRLTAQNLYDYARTTPAAAAPAGPAPRHRDGAPRLFLNMQTASPPPGHRRDKTARQDRRCAGIEWLPRIIPKTKAKLRGELRDLMYCCGGDRRFFQAHSIHPANSSASSGATSTMMPRSSTGRRRSRSK